MFYLNKYDERNRVVETHTPNAGWSYMIYNRLGQMTSYAGPKMTGQKLFTVNEMGYWRKIPPYGVFTLTYIAVCIE